MMVGYAFIIATLFINAQDTNCYKLRLDLPVFDYPQNVSFNYRFPSMNQAMEVSNDFYELSFWGVNALGDKIFISKTKPYSKKRKILNKIFKYGVSLAFSKYGSELPIPLGVWGHEEFHRSALAVGDVSSKNGNWIFSRWDGTVYGVSDSALNELKANKTDQLLYSYVSGVQYEIALNEKTTLNDFYLDRSLKKNALLLYNAYYVFNYFRFSTSAISDSVKVLAPLHENKNSEERDFAGADLTAWAYDMFNPSLAFTSRDSFPNGNGVNRRVGFSDLSPEAQSFLKTQKNLSLLNFLNPAIFFVNKIKINDKFSFNCFAQYSPTHFGNDVAVFILVKYGKFDLQVNVHRYSGKAKSAFGFGAGLYNYALSPKIKTDLRFNLWNQPKTFFSDEFIFGGMAELKTNYFFNENLSAYVSISGKTKGWIIGNPYLSDNFSARAGVCYNLLKK